LAMVERVGAARRRCVVARWLVCERCECEAVGVEQRRGEPPWLGVPPRSRVLVLNIFLVANMSVNGFVSSLFVAFSDGFDVGGRTSRSTSTRDVPGDMGWVGSRNTYREGCATSSASVSEWPEPAIECDRCWRCGKVALKSSRSFPSGF
jgi:hypothetical protein